MSSIQFATFLFLFSSVALAQTANEQFDVHCTKGLRLQIGSQRLQFQSSKISEGGNTYELTIDGKKAKAKWPVIHRMECLNDPDVPSWGYYDCSEYDMMISMPGSSENSGKKIKISTTAEGIAFGADSSTGGETLYRQVPMKVISRGNCQ